MRQRPPVGAVRLVEELQSQVRPELKRTLDQSGRERTCDDLAVGSPFIKTELNNGNRRDLDDAFLAQRREPRVSEQRFGRGIQLDAVLT